MASSFSCTGGPDDDDDEGEEEVEEGGVEGEEDEAWWRELRWKDREGEGENWFRLDRVLGLRIEVWFELIDRDWIGVETEMEEEEDNKLQRFKGLVDRRTERERQLILEFLSTR